MELKCIKLKCMELKYIKLKCMELKCKTDEFYVDEIQGKRKYLNDIFKSFN